MHSDIHIHRFSARHRVADADAARVAKAAQQQLLDGELEAALGNIGWGDELVLVKRLSAQVRLSAERVDRDNARRWSDALAAKPDTRAATRAGA